VYPLFEKRVIIYFRVSLLNIMKKLTVVIVLLLCCLSAKATPSGYAFETNDSQHVFYMEGPHNGLSINEYHIIELTTKLGSGNWHYRDLTAKTNAPLFVSSPSGYAWEKDGTQHVIYVDKDGHIQELWTQLNTANPWQRNDLTALTNAPVAALGFTPTFAGYAWEGDNTQHVVYVGPNRHIQELWTRKGSSLGWISNDLTANAIGADGVAGAPPSLISY